MTEARLKHSGVLTVDDLVQRSLPELEASFGRYGLRLHELARGIDHNPVISDRAVKSISAEGTFPRDLPLAATEDHVRRLAASVGSLSPRHSHGADRRSDVYADLKTQVFESLKTMKRGDPNATVDAMFKLVDAEHPPLRLFLGSHNLPHVRAAYADRLTTWEEWESVATSAQVN